MNDPRNALRIYIAIVVIAIMFSPRWGKVRSYITTAKTAAKAKGTK